MVKYNDRAKKFGESVIHGIDLIRSKEDIQTGLTTIATSMVGLIYNIETDEEAEYFIRFVDTLNVAWKDALGTDKADKKNR